METDYWHSLDKENYFRINPKTLGVSTLPTKKGIEQLKARVFEGARNVELGFMGKEKGNLGQGGITPGMHSKEEREDIRQMAKINEVDLSTHASIGIGGLSGLGEGGFKPELKETAVNEIKRTVDFAAEVAGGGPVVVHTGEFPRPISAAGVEFEAFPQEERRATQYLVDEKTGKVIDAIRKDVELPMPVWKKNEKDQYVDEKEKVIPEEEIFKKRIPVVENGKIKIENRQWEYFEKETKRWNELHHKPEDKLTPAQFAYKDKLDARRKQLESEEELYLDKVRDSEKALKQVEADQKLLKLSEEGKLYGEGEGELMIKQQIDEIKKKYPEGNPEKVVNSLKRQVEYYREGAIGFAQGAKQVVEEVKKAIPMEDFGVKESADALARSGIYAYDKERTMKLKKPLFVAPENIFPEQFGAHPQELKKLVLDSRTKMVEVLQKDRGMGKTQAKKIADDHIKATFDIGHANIWKKFFKGPEKEFKQWMIKQTEDLQKSGVLGHVHISDNFGYYDEHLEPGGGNVPIKELVDKLEKAGYKGKQIVEGGAQTPEQSFRVWSKALGLSSSTYKMDGQWSWTDIDSSYFGRTGSPTYLVGEHVPSKDWTLWSETPFE